jgi:dTDP-4-amino-4,6-dideoxygalactose transaminase
MLRFIRPTIPEPPEWLPFLAESYRQRIFSNFGPAATRLEEALTAKYGNGRQAVLTANATAGLTAALLAWGVQGRVVVPAFTFPATAQAVLQAGCEPLFCDVSPQTWELDPSALEQVLRRQRIACVMPVRSYGFCRDLKTVAELCQARGIPVLVDAAAALGGRLNDHRYCGGEGDAEVFSLHATKVFGVGEGGVVFVPPQRVAPLRRVLNFGLERQDLVSGGMNGKASEFHAAVGLAVLQRIDFFIERRTRIARRYQKAFAGLDCVELPPPGGAPPWQTFPLRLTDETADASELSARVLRHGVEVRRYYLPVLTDTTLFAGAASGPVEESRRLSRGMVCLPIYSDMTDAEADFVIAVVRHVLETEAKTPLCAA